MYRQFNIETKMIGPISIISRERIEEIMLTNPHEDSKTLAYRKYGPLERGKCGGVEEFQSFLDSYFKGEDYDFCLDNLNLERCSPFQRKVLKSQVKTPFGKTNYYKDIAIDIGNPRASRAVGNALRNNPFPIVIPCHRTIRGDNEIGGFGGDVKNHYKKILLLHEGNTIENNRVIKKSI